MQLSQIFKILHNKIEAQLFGDRITNKEMAEKLGCCEDTYARYKKGGSQPEGSATILKLLNMLEKDEDIIDIVRQFDTPPHE